MKVPKKIIELLNKRTRAAIAWNRADWEISEWVDKHNIIADMEDYHGGIESITNPEESAQKLIEAIERM